MYHGFYSVSISNDIFASQVSDDSMRADNKGEQAGGGLACQEFLTPVRPLQG